MPLVVFEMLVKVACLPALCVIGDHGGPPAARDPQARAAGPVRQATPAPAPAAHSQAEATRQRVDDPATQASSAELRRLDSMHQMVISSQPVAEWRFETIRLGYQRLLKQAGSDLELEEALRTRLNRLTQHEQAARAARSIESILAESHRRDHDVAAIRRKLAQVERSRAAQL